MDTRSAHTAVIVLGFLLILLAIALKLHLPTVDGKLLAAFIGVGLFLMLLARWMRRKTGIVRVIRPYRRLGFGTTVFVLGVLLILGAITLLLMQYPLADPLYIELAEGRIRLPGLHKLLPVIGVILMLLGLWINQSDKYYIRLPQHS